jgi:hypothetical protein
MKAQMGSKDTPTVFTLGSRWGTVVDTTPRPL